MALRVAYLDAFVPKSGKLASDAQSCSLAPHEDIRVIGVANEPKPAPRQFTIMGADGSSADNTA